MTKSGWLTTPAAVVVVFGLLGAACAGGDSSNELGEGSPAPDVPSSTVDSVPPAEPIGDPDGTVTVVHEPEIFEPETVWHELLLEMDDDGRVPKEIALEAFALAYGPIPGVEVRAGDPGLVTSMTARSWLSYHWDRLTSEQTEAINAALQMVDADGRPADEWGGAAEDGTDQDEGDEEALGENGVHLIAFAQEAPAEGPVSCWGSPIVLANAPGSEQYRPLIDQGLADLAPKLGPLGIPVYLGFAQANGTVLADADPWTADCDQRAVSCTVRLLPAAVAAFTADRDNLRSLLLHELVHCYQGARAPVNNLRNSLPWIREGYATYAQWDVHPEIPSIVTPWWSWWFGKHTHPLFNQSYEAIGFFAHLTAIGADPWRSLEAALATTDSAAQFEIFVGDVRLELLQTWASSLSRLGDLGPEWDDALPGTPDVYPVIATATINEETRHSFNTTAYSARLTYLDFRADLIVVDPLAGHGRIAWESGDEILIDPAGPDTVYCTVAGGCECPGGQTPTGMSDTTADIQQSPPGLGLLALAADGEPGEVLVTGMSLSEACQAPPAGEGPSSGSTLWEGNVCELLSDADVAAVFGGRAPTSIEPADANTVPADGYGGASCRWKVSVADHLLLDVFPAAGVDIDELAAYDPDDRWNPETLGGIGDEARVLRWNGDPVLLVDPGSVGSIVVLEGDVGLRLAITAGWPLEPDGLIKAAQVVLEGGD